MIFDLFRVFWVIQRLYCLRFIRFQIKSISFVFELILIENSFQVIDISQTRRIKILCEAIFEPTVREHESHRQTHDSSCCGHAIGLE